MRLIAAITAFLFVSHAAALRAEDVTTPFALIEISSDPEAEEQTVYSLRFSPAVSFACDVVEFECVYQQAFPWENFHGKAYIKIHEPVNFLYRREGIRFVAQLDWMCSFRVPTARRLLDEMYGDKTFNRNHPVSVDRIIIRGKRGDQTLWCYELPAKGRYTGHDLAEYSCKASGTGKK